MVSFLRKWYWPIGIILLLFAGSILLRAQSFGIDPNASQHWSSYNRFNNDEVFNHDYFNLYVYDHYPVQVHKFAGYIGSGGNMGFLLNKKDPELTVYTSFPPTHFIVLWSALKLFHAPNIFLSVQVFSLAIQLTCVLLVFWLAYVLTRSKFIGVLAASAYIFSAGTLQYHMNVYWAHQLLMPVFLASLILFVKRKGMFKWWESALLGFIMTIITWTGAFAAVGYALYGLFKWHKTKDKRYLDALYMLAGGAVAVLLILLQALWVTGADISQYFGAVSARVAARSPDAGHMPLPRLIWLFTNDLLLDYGVYILIAWSLLLIRRLKGFEWGVLFVAAFPILESFILLEHDEVYGFGRLKWLVPAIVLISICGNKFATTKTRKIVLASAMTVAALVHAGLYLVIYNY